MDYIKMTDEFITAMGQDKNVELDKYDDLDVLRLRMSLLREELREVEEEAGNIEDVIYQGVIEGEVSQEDLKRVKVALLKELCDLQYVLSGFAVTFGLPLDEAFKLVHESNMSKLGPDGKPIYRGDGKVLKGPNYKKPDLSDLV